MKELKFDLELNSEGLDERQDYTLYVEAEERLRLLANGHDDLHGAAINLRKPAHGETTYLFEATVVVYARPENMAASEKRNSPLAALKGALDAIERQVRQKREKLGNPWEQPSQGPITTEVIEAELSEDVNQPDRID